MEIAGEVRKLLKTVLESGGVLEVLKMSLSGKLLLGVLVFTILLMSCDIYEDEKDDWPNDVTVIVYNYSECLVDVQLDGGSAEGLNPGESKQYDELGQGVHFIEAYPWNDSKHSCDSVFTDELANDELFECEITTESACNVCDPTPTPDLVSTPTPTGTPGS